MPAQSLPSNIYTGAGAGYASAPEGIHPLSTSKVQPEGDISFAKEKISSDPLSRREVQNLLSSS